MQKLQKNNKFPKGKIFLRRCRKFRLAAVSLTASAFLVVSPCAVYAAGTDDAVTGAPADSESTEDIGENDADKNEEENPQTHVESDSERDLRKIAGDMLKDAKSIENMISTYGYAEKTDKTSPKDLEPGSIIIADGIYYMVMSYTDADGNTAKELWKEDGSGGFIATNEFPDDCEKEFTVEKKYPDVTLPEGLTGSTDQTLSDIVLPDSFSWKYPTTEIAEGENGYTAIYTPENYLLYRPKETVIKVNGAVTTHSLTRPASSYTFNYSRNMKLSDVPLPDNWSFEYPDRLITVGTHTYKAVFTGDKRLHWSASTDDAMVTITANKQKIMFGQLAVTVNQGAVLADNLLPARSDGKLSWMVQGQTVSTPGVFTYYARYTPNDTEVYDTTENISVSVTVREVKKLARPASAYTVAYDPDAKVSSVSLPENWKFDNPEAKIQLGTHKYRASFTGDRSAIWSDSTDSIDVEIRAEKTPITVAPLSITVTAGAKLTNDMLPDRNDGVLKWKSKNDRAGFTRSVHYAVFTPKDQERYVSAGDVSVTVLIKKKSETKKDDKDSKDNGKDVSGKSGDSGNSEATGKNSKNNGKKDDSKSELFPVDVKQDSESSITKKERNESLNMLPEVKTSQPDAAESGSDDSAGNGGSTDRPRRNTARSTGSKNNSARPDSGDTKKSSENTSKKSEKAKKKIKLKNITNDDIIPIISPQKDKKDVPSNPLLTNVEAKPLKKSDSKSAVKDIGAGSVKTVKKTDKNTDKKDPEKSKKDRTEDKKEKEKKENKSDTDKYYTPDDTPDEMDVTPENKKKEKKEGIAEKITDIKNRIGKKQIIIAAAVLAAVIIATAGGAFIFGKKKKEEE